MIFPFGFWKGIGSSLDADAREFIRNWEASTGAVMQLTQRMAVNDWYLGMKGTGTVYGSDLWNKVKTVTNVYCLFWLHYLSYLVTSCLLWLRSVRFHFLWLELFHDSKLFT